MHYRQWLALNDDQKMVYYLGLAECTVPLLHGSPHIAFIREKAFPAARAEQLETQMFALLAAAPDDIFDKDWVLARLNAAS